MVSITLVEPASRNSIARALVALGLLTLAGCAVSNEGAVDYRKADLVRPDMRGIEPAAGPPGTALPAQAPAISEIVAPARLHRQALRGDPEALVEKGDSIAIRLRSAFLKDFEALIGHPLRGFRPNGEIAIVVKAFEFGKGDDFHFEPDAVREGRLVFYSPDVEKGQLLNFNNLPVYGPITYQGNPIGLDISVIEIDADDAQIAALLGTLAKIGAQVYPPAAPVLPVLDLLGQALLNGGTNDVEMRFTLMLDPAAGYAGVSHPVVEAGDYVFVKEDVRTAKTPWAELVVDTNTGRVYRNGSDYVENTYLTFQIDKNLSSTDIDLSQNTFGRFLDALDKEDVERAADLQPFLDELEQLGVQRVQTRRFGEARNLLTEWQDARQADPGKAKRAAFKLYTVLQEAIAAQTATPPKDADLAPEQVDYLLDKLAAMAKAGALAEIGLFTRAGFQGATFEDLFAAVQAGSSA